MESQLRSGGNVPDNMPLLEQMMEDMSQASDMYKPTNYWKFYEKRFLPELRKHGLRDMRRRHGSILNSFGATDYGFKGYFQFKTPFKGHNRVAIALNRFIDKMPLLKNGLLEWEPEWVNEYLYWYVKDKFQKAGLDLKKCPTTNWGYPEDITEVDGGLWSFKHLNFCAIFGDLAARVKMSSDITVCELGAGLGRNIEIMAKLFENATILLFDIPPQLYTSNQYLTAIFGDRVIPYDQAIQIPTDSAEEMKRAIQGRICVLPAWKMPEWSKFQIDLFYNSESFQEMEVEVVRNYLSLVTKMRPKHIYINAYPNGPDWLKNKKGGGGLEAPVPGSCYIEALRGQYDLIDEYKTDNLLRRKDYRSYLFAPAK